VQYCQICHQNKQSVIANVKTTSVSSRLPLSTGGEMNHVWGRLPNEARKAENRGRRPTAWVGGVLRGQKAKVSGGALWAPPAGFGAEFFHYYQHPGEPDTIISLIVDHNNEKNSYPIHSILSQLLCIWWRWMMFFLA